MTNLKHNFSFLLGSLERARHKGYVFKLNSRSGCVKLWTESPNRIVFSDENGDKAFEILDTDTFSCYANIVTCGSEIIFIEPPKLKPFDFGV